MTEARQLRAAFEYEVLLAANFDQVLAGTGNPIAMTALLDRLLGSGRLLIQGRGGSGKTYTAQALIKMARRRGYGTAFVRSWQLRSVDTRNSLVLGGLLDVASDVSRRERILDGRGIVVIDGLNEVPRSTSDWLLEEIPFLLASTVGLAFLATDRLTRRPAANLWPLATLGPVPNEVIRRLVGADPATSGEHLHVPYYLLRAIAEGTEPSRGETIEDFLTGHGGVSPDSIGALAEAAYESYRSRHDRIVDLPSFAASVGDEQVAELFAAGVIVDPASPRFEHHLVHDYLAARHLASNRDAWDEGGFDVVTLDATSFDALGLVLARLDDREVDDFVHRTYDWNLYGAADVLEQDAAGEGRISSNMRLVLLAMLAEKQFDRMRPTAQRANDALRLQRDRSADEMLLAQSRGELVEIASRRLVWGSPPVWLREWFDLFSKPDGTAATQGEVDAIASEFAALGWVASNALRRARLSGKQVQGLCGLVTGSSSEVVRWRAVHVLGASSDPAARESLFGVLDRTDGSKWVRYGALRSLLELAASSDQETMAHILARLGEPERASRIASTPYLQREAVNGLDLVDPPVNWLSAAESLMSELWRQKEEVGSGREVFELAERVRSATMGVSK